MKCNYCGNEVPNGSLTCPSCGGPVQQPQGVPMQQAPQGVPPVQQGMIPGQKSRTVYILLAFFLGTLGVHNFYAGRIVQGVVQLLITIISCGFLSGISGIWALVEMFTVTQDSKGVPMQDADTKLATILAIVWAALFLAVVFLSALSEM